MDEVTVARLEQLLEDTLELAEENNKILISMQRTARWSFWGKVLLWTLVIVLPFLFLGPILHALIPLSNTPGVGGGSLFGLPSQEQIKGLLEAYKHASSTAP